MSKENTQYLCQGLKHSLTGESVGEYSVFFTRLVGHVGASYQGRGKIVSHFEY